MHGSFWRPKATPYKCFFQYLQILQLMALAMTTRITVWIMVVVVDKWEAMILDAEERLTWDARGDALGKKSLCFRYLHYIYTLHIYMTGLLHEGIFHVWKLALGLCDVQLSSDFNMSETLTHTVKWPQELAIYGPRHDLWPLRFSKNFEPLSCLNLESYLSSYLWRTIFQLVCGISPYSALLGLTGSFIAFADWPN